MRMPDVNILIYAHRKEDPDHGYFKAWIERLVNGREPFALSPLVACGFVRIVTNPAFRPAPTPLTQALSVVESLRRARTCVMPELGRAHWNLVRHLCEETGATGKLVADAQHAAMAMENGCTWVTRDSDFEKFRPCGLRVEILSLA